MNFHEKNTDQKIEQLLNKLVNIDTTIENVKNDNDHIHTENRKLLEEMQKSQKQRDKQLKWIISVLITVSITFILFAILTTFLGNSYQIFGISELYDNVNHAIKTSKSPFSIIWYAFYFIPYVFLGALICLLYGLADRISKK